MTYFAIQLTIIIVIGGTPKLTNIHDSLYYNTPLAIPSQIEWTHYNAGCTVPLAV